MYSRKVRRPRHDKESLILPMQSFLFKGPKLSVRHGPSSYYPFFLIRFMLPSSSGTLCIYLFEYTKACKYMSRILMCQMFPGERKPMRVLGIVTHSRNSSIHEDDRKMMSSRPAWTVSQVQVQPGVLGETLSQNRSDKTKSSQPNNISPQWSLKTLRQTFKTSRRLTWGSHLEKRQNLFFLKYWGKITEH